MTTQNTSKIHKLAIGILFVLSIFMATVTLGTLTGYASTLNRADYQAELTPQWQATPTADYFATATAQPQTKQVSSSDTSILTYLPIIIRQIVQDQLVTAFGPVLDPVDPAGVVGQVSTPIIDPDTPTPPTSTPGPTTSPTPGPGSPTWTPTSKPTLSPTPMPTATRQLVSGGDLEDKDERNKWTGYSWRGYNLFFDGSEAPQAPDGAFSGDWYIWLGGATDGEGSVGNKEISYVQRQYTIPNPAKGQYKRYYLGHAARFQSYDSVCATTKYGSMGTDERSEMLAGYLRHTNANTVGMLDQFGVDLGGMIICVNKSGKSGCDSDAVEDLSGGKKAIYVVYYDLCSIGGGTDWQLFLFPIATETGGPNLAGKTVTVQIKVVTDVQLSSSVLVDDVAFWYGPPLPTPTPTPSTLSTEIQTQSRVHIGVPILVSDTPPDPGITGAQIIQTGEKKSTNPGNTNWSK